MRLLSHKELDQNTYELTVELRSKYFGAKTTKTFIGFRDDWKQTDTGENATEYQCFLLSRIYKTVRTKDVIESPHKKRKVKAEDLLNIVDKYKLRLTFDRNSKGEESWTIVRPSSSSIPVNELRVVGNEIAEALMHYWDKHEAKFQEDYE